MFEDPVRIPKSLICFALLQQKIETMLPTARHKHLLDVCRTRWDSRIDGLAVFIEIFVSIVASLEAVKCKANKSWSSAARRESHCHFLLTVAFEFIVCLVVVARLLEITSPLTKQLQSADIDFIDSIEKVTLLFAMLLRLRREVDVFRDEWYGEAVELAEKVGTIPLKPRIGEVQLHRSNIPASTPSEYYKKNLTIPFLDHMSNEMQTRFCQVNLELLNVFYTLPNVIVRDSSWMQSFERLLSLYEDDLPQPRFVKLELKTWETKWKMFNEVPPSD